MTAMADCVDEALAFYGLTHANATLLRHNENRTYHIDCGEASYCLRLKSPVSGFDLSVFGGNPENLLRGELALMSAVCAHTDIPVQVPVCAPSGGMTARLSDGTLASLLRWMNGAPLKEGPRSEAMLFSAGQTLATLRTAAETNPALRGFARLSYDQNLLRRLAAKAEQGGAYLSDASIRSITAALRAVASVMDELDGLEESTVAHADPGLGNLIWTGERVGLIDWSLSGYAHSYMDLGGLMGATADRDEQRCLLRGWESVRGPANRRYLDAYFSLGVLLFVCCQHSRAHEWADWFPAALERWQTTIFDPLAAGCTLSCIL